MLERPMEGLSDQVLASGSVGAPTTSCGTLIGAGTGDHVTVHCADHVCGNGFTRRPVSEAIPPGSYVNGDGTG